MFNRQWFSLPVFLIILEVNMKSSQSKFSNKRASLNKESSSKGSSAVSGCCCGSKLSENVEATTAEDEK